MGKTPILIFFCKFRHWHPLCSSNNHPLLYRVDCFNFLQQPLRIGHTNESPLVRWRIDMLCLLTAKKGRNGKYLHVHHGWLVRFVKKDDLKVYFLQIRTFPKQNCFSVAYWIGWKLLYHDTVGSWTESMTAWAKGGHRGLWPFPNRSCLSCLCISFFCALLVMLCRILCTIILRTRVMFLVTLKTGEAGILKRQG